MDSKIDFSKKTFAVITGASQGIGRTIAIEMAAHLKRPSILLLIARSEAGLSETKNLIMKINKTITIEICSGDLSKMEKEDYEKAFDKLSLKSEAIEAAIIVHNAGQVGELNNAIELNNFKLWRDYFDLNLFSVPILNSVFLEKMRKFTKTILVVNITSLCGRKPFKNLALYGSAKAAREIFFKVLAEEEKDLIVLNYSPGPVRTAMVDNIIQNVKNPEIKDMYIQMNDTILTCEQTVAKLFSLLEKGGFASGDTIDYYD